MDTSALASDDADSSAVDVAVGGAFRTAFAFGAFAADGAFAVAADDASAAWTSQGTVESCASDAVVEVVGAVAGGVVDVECGGAAASPSDASVEDVVVDAVVDAVVAAAEPYDLDGGVVDGVASTDVGVVAVVEA